MNKLRTSWSKKNPPFGAFDDYIIIEAIDSNGRILIRPEEFDFLASKLLDNWNKDKSRYIQILKEWNEVIRFYDVLETPSVLLDVSDTIDAMQLIHEVESMEFGKLVQTDIQLIVDYLIKNQLHTIKI
ncbi:hypothetical protein [Kordia sp.]|uniref:hypothetical protein n=1 Tax=Kordia sp. TaxID=1965332 RepID=UPI0025C12EA8|nr:hypothetical protein [Kordia sp.]MCH2196514.1 hypothetical protein [Kordia sp.]